MEELVEVYQDLYQLVEDDNHELLIERTPTALEILQNYSQGNYHNNLSQNSNLSIESCSALVSLLLLLDTISNTVEELASISIEVWKQYVKFIRINSYSITEDNLVKLSDKLITYMHDSIDSLSTCFVSFVNSTNNSNNGTVHSDNALDCDQLLEELENILPITVYFSQRISVTLAYCSSKLSMEIVHQLLFALLRYYGLMIVYNTSNEEIISDYFVKSYDYLEKGLSRIKSYKNGAQSIGRNSPGNQEINCSLLLKTIVYFISNLNKMKDTYASTCDPYNVLIASIAVEYFTIRQLYNIDNWADQNIFVNWCCCIDSFFVAMSAVCRIGKFYYKSNSREAKTLDLVMKMELADRNIKDLQGNVFDAVISSLNCGKCDPNSQLAYIVSRSCLPFFETEGYMYRQLLVSIVTALAVKSDQSSQNSGIILIANLLWNLFLRCLASKQQAKKFVGIVPTLRTILLVGDLVITTEIMNLIIDLLTNRVGDTLARNAYASQLLEKLLQYLPLHQIVKCGDSCKQLVEKLVHNSLGTIESVESGDTNRRSPTVYRLADAICILIAVASTEKLSKADSNSNSSAMTSLVGLFIRNACVGTYVVKVITNLSKIIPVLFKNYFEEYLRQNSCEIASRISVDLSRCLNLLILTNCMSDLLQAHEIPKSVQSLLLLAGNNIVDLLNDSIKLSDKLIVGCKADSHVNTTFAKSMDNYVVLATCLTATISRFSFNVIVLVGGAKYLLNSNEGMKMLLAKLYSSLNRVSSSKLSINSMENIHLELGGIYTEFCATMLWSDLLQSIDSFMKKCTMDVIRPHLKDIVPQELAVFMRARSNNGTQGRIITSTIIPSDTLARISQMKDKTDKYVEIETILLSLFLHQLKVSSNWSIENDDHLDLSDYFRLLEEKGASQHSTKTEVSSDSRNVYADQRMRVDAAHKSECNQQFVVENESIKSVATIPQHKSGSQHILSQNSFSTSNNSINSSIASQNYCFGGTAASTMSKVASQSPSVDENMQDLNFRHG